MTTDMKSMTVEELCEKALYTRLAAYEIARRLEEAQQKIVAQQARIEQLRGYACSCNRSSDLLSLPCMVHDRPEMDDLSALAAHDAELTAKAKAEALEEAADKCKRLAIRGRVVTHKDCVDMLDSEAAEYRAKAGRKE